MQIFAEWRNEQENSTYPFSDKSTLTNGSRTIRKSVFVDARVYPVGGLGEQWLSSIAVNNTTITVIVSDSSGELASGSFNIDDQKEVIYLSDRYSRPAGVFVVNTDDFAAISSWGAGVHTFTQAQTELCATVVVPTPQVGVRGILLEDGSLFAGEVWLVGENGVFFSASGDTIRVDMAGDPAAAKKFCTALDAYDHKRFLVTINSIPPNQYGDFKLLSGTAYAADTVLHVLPVAGGLKVELVGGTDA